MQINYGPLCGCRRHAVVICIKCELFDSLKIANAFEKSGHVVFYQHCTKHIDKESLMQVILEYLIELNGDEILGNYICFNHMVYWKWEAYR